MTPEERKLAVLRFILRYGAVSIDMLMPLFYAGLSRDTARKDLQGFVAERLIDTSTATDGVVYYLSTERLCVRLGVHRSAAGGTGNHALATKVGTAWFCVRNGFTRLTAREFREHYPDFYSRKVPSGAYFLDQTEEVTRLGWIEVDTAKDSRRVIRSINRIFTGRFAVPAMARLIHARQFYVVCICPSEGKRQVIQIRLDAKACGELPVRLAVVPEIQGILCGE